MQGVSPLAGSTQTPGSQDGPSQALLRFPVRERSTCMNKSMTCLFAALLVSLAGCEHATVPQGVSLDIRNQIDPSHERVWRLGRDGVFLLDRIAPARFGPPEGCQWAAPPSRSHP